MTTPQDTTAATTTAFAQPPSALTTSFRLDPPSNFNFSAPNEWTAWKRRFHTLSGLQHQPGQHQVDALIYLLGPQAEDVFQTFNLQQREAFDFDLVLDKFEKYFIPRRNVIYERAKFNTRTQLESETVDDFVTALHKLADTCEYGSLRDDLLRDRLVVGLCDTRLSEKLQLDPEHTLVKALTTACQHEAVKREQTALRPTAGTKEVARLTSRRSVQTSL